MLPHVSPMVRGVPNPGDVLHHEGPWDGRGADPLLVLIEDLEGLNPGLLPQHCETLVAGDPSGQNAFGGTEIVDTPRNWCIKARGPSNYSRSDDGQTACRFFRLG